MQLQMQLRMQLRMQLHIRYLREDDVYGNVLELEDYDPHEDAPYDSWYLWSDALLESESEDDDHSS
jgi:hypothetical protein